MVTIKRQFKREKKKKKRVCECFGLADVFRLFSSPYHQVIGQIILL